MENEISAVIILFVGLVVAVVVHFIIVSTGKSKSEQSEEDIEEIAATKIEQLQTSKTVVSLGIWEGVKFGIGLSIGFFLTSVFFGLVFATTFVKIIEGIIKH